MSTHGSISLIMLTLSLISPARGGSDLITPSLAHLDLLLERVNCAGLRVGEAVAAQDPDRRLAPVHLQPACRPHPHHHQHPPHKVAKGGGAAAAFVSIIGIFILIIIILILILILPKRSLGLR
jgi:hypothetical protein